MSFSNAHRNPFPWMIIVINRLRCWQQGKSPNSSIKYAAALTKWVNRFLVIGAIKYSITWLFKYLFVNGSLLTFSIILFRANNVKLMKWRCSLKPAYSFQSPPGILTERSQPQPTPFCLSDLATKSLIKPKVTRRRFFNVIFAYYSALYVLGLTGTFVQLLFYKFHSPPWVFPTRTNTFS